MFFKVLLQKLCVFVIKGLMAMIAVNSFVLVNLCVAIEGTAHLKETHHPVRVTMVLMEVRASVVCLNIQDLNVTNALQTLSAGQLGAMFHVFTGMQPDKTKTNVPAILVPP